MAGRTSENKWARRWGPREPQQGNRRTNRSQHVVPFLLLWANMGLFTCVWGRGGSLGRHVDPRGAHTDEGGGGLAICNLLSPRLWLQCVSSPAKVVHSASQFTRTNVESFFLFRLYIHTCNSQGRPSIWNFEYWTHMQHNKLDLSLYILFRGWDIISWGPLW